MTYHIRFVRDDSLPAGVDWVVARVDELCYLFVKVSAASSGVTIPAAAARAMRRLADSDAPVAA